MEISIEKGKQLCRFMLIFSQKSKIDLKYMTVGMHRVKGRCGEGGENEEGCEGRDTGEGCERRGGWGVKGETQGSMKRWMSLSIPIPRSPRPKKMQIQIFENTQYHLFSLF